MRQTCSCGSKERPEALSDGHGIFMTYACSKCRQKKIAKFRPDIFEKYEADEPIEPEGTK
jgi:hypothetical protein